MRRPLLLVLILLVIGGSIAALLYMGSADGNGNQIYANDSPTEAYKRLFAAVKAKDIEAIKKQITKKTIDLGKLSMGRFNKTEREAYENGFTATTFSETLPQIRDERIKGNMGAVEVWNARENRWEDLPFMLEDGSWKLAWGELFAGTFQSPGKGRDQLEKEAANAVANIAVQMPNANPTNGANRTK